MEYRHGSYAIFTIHLHLVLITKYRKKMLEDAVAHRVREMIRDLCTLIAGHVARDHVHLFVSIPPQVTIKLTAWEVQCLTGRFLNNLRE
jgi:putative transposase